MKKITRIIFYFMYSKNKTLNINKCDIPFVSVLKYSVTMKKYRRQTREATNGFLF